MPDPNRDSCLVSISAVTKEFLSAGQSVKVLSDLSLDLQRSEFAAIMGPSGSGKSTLLSLIGGLDRPTSGTIRVNQTTISTLSDGEQARWRSNNVGFVFQFYHLISSLNALENVEVPLYLRRLSTVHRRKKAEAALALVGLGDQSKSKPAELSGGQQQRVAIARAIVANPSLLICDEPTGDLDRESADEILDLLRILANEQQSTVIMVTHDPKAAAYADKTLTLEKGRLATGH